MNHDEAIRSLPPPGATLRKVRTATCAEESPRMIEAPFFRSQATWKNEILL